MFLLIFVGIFLLVAFAVQTSRANTNRATRDPRSDIRLHVRFEQPSAPHPSSLDDPFAVSVEKSFLARLGKGVDRHSHSRIAGLSHPNADGGSRRKILRGCRRFESFLLVREPGNVFDPNAIMIFTSRDQMLGYLPRAKAAKIAPQMDQGKVWLALLLSVGGTAQHPATRLLLYRLTKTGRKNLLQLAKGSTSEVPRNAPVEPVAI